MASYRSIRRSALQLLGLFTSFLIAIALIYADVLVFGSIMGEWSLVQISQALMILGSAVFFALGARDTADQRGYLLLVATLFLSMFIRENDGPLDNIAHGFWLAPAALIGVVGAGAVYVNRRTLRLPFLQHAQDSSFWIIAVGFFQLIVFSRLFGSGLLWDHIPSQTNLDAVKSIIQEGIELVSYLLICFGSYLSYKHLFGSERASIAEQV